MGRRLTREDILNARGVYRYMENTIFVELEDDTYCLNNGTGEWEKNEKLYEYIESSLMMSYFSSITKEEVANLVEASNNIAQKMQNSKNKISGARLNQAIYFATERHAGQFRKATDTPFIVHPMEVMTILAGMKSDIDLLIAGILHDTVEDTETTLEEIEALFGAEVARLVAEHSEDKNLSWEERKEIEYRDTCSASLRLKKLVLADKLANLRSLSRDYKYLGTELWNHFRAGAEKQAWYYGKMTDALSDLQNTEDAQEFYWEMVELYKDVFVIFSLDESKGVLYQKNLAGEIYYLKKGKPEWKLFEGAIPKKAVTVHRNYAEQLEDSWNEPFWKTLEDDCADGSYNIYSSTSKSRKISMSKKQLTFSGENYDDVEYEFHYSLDEENTNALLMQLRNQYGIRYKLETVLKNAFGYEDGSVRFEQFCKDMGIVYRLFVL